MREMEEKKKMNLLMLAAPFAILIALAMMLVFNACSLDTGGATAANPSAGASTSIGAVSSTIN